MQHFFKKFASFPMQNSFSLSYFLQYRAIFRTFAYKTH